MKQEMRGSGISWTTYKSSAFCFIQITTPAHCHSNFSYASLMLRQSKL